jgi:hypothetical protein
MTCNMPAGDRAMPDDPEKIYSNTLVMISLKGELHQLGPDLEQKEFAAIGWVTAHWAILEHYLLHQSVEIAEGRGVERRSTERRWAKREKTIQRVINNTSGMYGDLQGRVGSSLATIPALTSGD